MLHPLSIFNIYCAFNTILAFFVARLCFDPNTTPNSKIGSILALLFTATPAFLLNFVIIHENRSLSYTIHRKIWPFCIVFYRESRRFWDPVYCETSLPHEQTLFEQRWLLPA